MNLPHSSFHKNASKIKIPQKKQKQKQKLPSFEKQTQLLWSKKKSRGDYNRNEILKFGFLSIIMIFFFFFFFFFAAYYPALATCFVAMATCC
jgi:quinol-cytochrome oxidoreductase complex cytochrome b subunit